jgi:hypothetical protein
MTTRDAVLFLVGLLFFALLLVEGVQLVLLSSDVHRAPTPVCTDVYPNYTNVPAC